MVTYGEMVEVYDMSFLDWPSSVVEDGVFECFLDHFGLWICWVVGEVEEKGVWFSRHVFFFLGFFGPWRIDLIAALKIEMISFSVCVPSSLY